MKVSTRFGVTSFVLHIVTFAGGTSLLQRRTNSSCTTNSDCLPLHSSCQPDKYCSCEKGYIAINRTRYNNYECVKVAKEEGDLCVHDLQCEALMGVHAGCISFNESNPKIGECHCLPKHHRVRKLCHPTSHIGDYCRVNDDCYLERKDITAYCSLGVCICPPGYHQSKDRKECLENQGLHGHCRNNEDCKYSNTVCSPLGYCICDDGFVENVNRTACEIPLTRLGDRCSNDSHCSNYLRETMCHPITKTCVCNVGAHEVNKSCYRIVRLGDVCMERLECVVPSDTYRVDCSGNICTCLPPYLWVEHDCLTNTESTQRHVAPNSSSKLGEHLQGTLIVCLLLHVMIYSSRPQRGNFS